MKKRSFVSLTLPFMLFFSACAAPKTESVCPPLISYSLAQQNGLSKELKSHPDLTYVPLFLEGYAQTRAGLKALIPPAQLAETVRKQQTDSLKQKRFPLWQRLLRQPQRL